MYKYLIIGVITMSMIILAKPGYYYIKNYIAQQMIESAWVESKSKKKIVYPWSDAKTYPIGKIEMKDINLSYTILGGDDSVGLDLGISHLSNSAYPGKNGNICLAAHRDTYFKKLEKTQLNDIIEIEHLNGADQYKVTDIEIASPEETMWLENTNSNLLTLVTCYPFNYIGNAPMRWIVRAEKQLASN